MIPPVPSKVGNISSSLLGFIRRFQSEGEGNNPLVQLNINIKTEFSRHIFTKMAAIVAYPILKALMKRMDYRRYNGAALLGLRGLVFKSHGSADAMAFEQALNRAYDAARNNLLDRVRTRIAHAAPLLAPGNAQPTPGAVATTH